MPTAEVVELTSISPSARKILREKGYSVGESSTLEYILSFVSDFSIRVPWIQGTTTYAVLTDALSGEIVGRGKSDFYPTFYMGYWTPFNFDLDGAVKNLPACRR